MKRKVQFSSKAKTKATTKPSSNAASAARKPAAKSKAQSGSTESRPARKSKAGSSAEGAPSRGAASGKRSGAKSAGTSGGKPHGKADSGMRQGQGPGARKTRGKRVAKAATKPPKAASGAQSRRAVQETVPPALFEAEPSVMAEVSGPGRRYALGPVPVRVQPELPDDLGELPEAYGSKRLFVAARDPHWLYAHWDFTSAQLEELNALSVDRHLVLRVHVGDFDAPPCNEVAVYPESRNWFVRVGRGGTKYVAELGYYRGNDREWTRVSRSAATLTPPELMEAGSGVDFATIPPDVPFEALLTLVQSAAKENVPLAEAIQQLRASGYPGLPEPVEWPKTDWTPEQERALAVAIEQSVSMDEMRRTWVGSLEITELLRRRLEGQRGSAELLSSAGLLSGASVSSPFGAVEQPRGFWFNINAELVIYGATEPDAQVTLAGRPVALRPDGSFSFRFALPDGRYELPVAASSADGMERREAELEFSRSTEYRGEVGSHPQEAGLEPPETAGV